MEEYGEIYYEDGIKNGVSCYEKYQWLPELTIPLTFEIIKYLNIKRTDSILDFGCSKGYLVKSFRLLHYDCYGVDISQYAIKSSPELKDFLTLINEGGEIPLIDGKIYDFIISKDVLEHVDYKHIDKILTDIRKNSKMSFFIIPLGDGTKYNVPDYNKDVTHKIKESIEWWNDKFSKNGFKVISSRYKVKYIKENWSQYDNGNGFFVLESIS